MDNEKDGVPAKKAKTLCKYKNTWEEGCLYITKSNVSQNHAFCKICRTDFSIGHGGKTDVSQHEKTNKHKRAQEAQKHASPMTAFVNRNVSEADKVIKAEVKMSMLCAKNNVPFSFCDDFNRSVADMFPDSAIARKYSAGKTKATQLIKGRLKI